MKKLNLGNCYYCNLSVTKKTHGWNARNQIGEISPVHDSCLKREEQIILDINDWNRGEQYSCVHILINPLSESIYIAECGCKVSILKDSPDGEYEFSVLEHLCMKHKIFRLVNNPIGLNMRYKWNWLDYLNEHIFKKLDKQLDKQLNRHYENLFREAYATGIINDLYHGKEYNMDNINKIE